MTVSDLLVLDTHKKASRGEIARSPAGALGVLAGTSAALALVGWTDWVLLWVPLGFGNVEWEFGTISRSFDALPLATIGTAVFIAVALNSGWRRTLLAAAVATSLLVAAFVLVFGVYLLDLPVLLNGAPGPARMVLFKAVAKTSLYGVLYTVTYAWLCRTCWRAVRHTSRGN
jgi:hypothetical protein